MLTIQVDLLPSPLTFILVYGLCSSRLSEKPFNNLTRGMPNLMPEDDVPNW
jgi:hypothetical protein